MQVGTVLRASLRLGTETPGLRQMPELTTQLQAAQNAVINATQATTGKIRHVYPTQKQMSHALDFRRTPSGIQLQPSLRLGTDQPGLLQQPESTTKPQAAQNAVTNAAAAITGKILLAYPTQKQQAAPDFRQTQVGTPLQALPRLGTDRPILLQQPESTTKPQAPQNADTNAAAAITGKIRHVYPTQKQQAAQGFRQTHNGTAFQQSPKTGTALPIPHQQPEFITRLQARLNAVSNARQITLGRTTRPAKPIKKFRTAPVFRQTQSGTQLQLLRRLGTETTGLQQRPELTTRLQAQANADTNAILITT